jgi:Protein of unknown function (DUF998)
MQLLRPKFSLGSTFMTSASPSRAATFALAAAGLFIGLVLVLHVVRADLEPSWHMVSEYSVGPGGWLMQLAFLALASSFLSLMLALRLHTPGALGISGRVFLGIAGVGATFGGLFNTDPPGTAPEHISTTGMLHGFAFMLGVPGVLVAVTLLTVALWRSPDWRSASSAAHLSHARVGNDAGIRRGHGQCNGAPRDGARVCGRVAKSCTRPRLGVVGRSSCYSLPQAVSGSPARALWLSRILAFGSLDNPNAVEPELHYWYSEHLSWVAFEDTLPKHPEFPPQESAD